jgi:hypothetical protein
MWTIMNGLETTENIYTSTTEGGAFLNMVFFTTMFTTADVNIHALIAKYGIVTEFLTPAFINNKT